MNDFKWIWTAGATVAIMTAANLITMYAKQESILTRLSHIEPSLQSAHDTNGRQWERFNECKGK